MNPKDRAALNRVPLHLLPKAGMIEGAMACRLGAIKYGPMNWRDKPISLMSYIGAIERHLTALQDGQDFDLESGVSHLGHVIATASILLDAELHDTLIDDRIKPSNRCAVKLDMYRAATEAGIKPCVYMRWMSVPKGENGDGCHEWQDTLNSHGYGVIYLDNECLQAHRVSYRIHKGDVPEGHVVRHTCDNPKCVNPEHLITGSKKQNSLDMVERGRSTRGRGKVSVVIQDEIAKRRIAGERGVDLAKEYGVTPAQVYGYKQRWLKYNST